jgi:RimJ/RimL family protein N-acetyltransferase
VKVQAQLDALSLRRATSSDCDQVYHWVNDPLTRQASFESAAIPYADHVGWFTQILADPTRQLFMAELAATSPSSARVPLGVVRFAVAETAAAAVISINLAPERRGRGMGKRLLHAATSEASALGYRRVDAYIRPSNLASIRSFEAAGYQLVEESTRSGQAERLYRLQLVTAP